MIKVSDAVKEIIVESEEVVACLSQGVLNLSAYAKRILPAVERRTKKPVKHGTIVAALARYARELEVKSSIVPAITWRDIAVKSGLLEIAFDKTRANRERLQVLYQTPQFQAADFLTVTHGVGELSIIINESLEQPVMQIFGRQKPKFVLRGLCGLTVRFDEHYIHEPGLTLSLVRKIAIKRINIVELVSTFTELTFLLYEHDMSSALAEFVPSPKAKPL
jgi:hypothetical protein